MSFLSGEHLIYTTQRGNSGLLDTLFLAQGHVNSWWLNWDSNIYPCLPTLCHCLLHSVFQLPIWQPFQSEMTALLAPRLTLLCKINTPILSLDFHELSLHQVILLQLLNVAAQILIQDRLQNSLRALTNSSSPQLQKSFILVKLFKLRGKSSLLLPPPLQMPSSGTCHLAFKEDVTYIFPYKLRAYLARPSWAGGYVQSLFCSQAGVDFWGVIYGWNANYLTTNM